MNNTEKAQLGAETLKKFCQQFGDDVHAHVLLEVLFDVLINVPENISVGTKDNEHTE